MTEEKPKAKRVCQTKEQLMTECMKWNNNVMFNGAIIPVLKKDKSTRITKKDTARGVRLGLPDIIIAKANDRYNGLCLWFKNGNKGKTTAWEDVNITTLSLLYGYKCMVIKSFEQFKKVLTAYKKGEL